MKSIKHGSNDRNQSQPIDFIQPMHETNGPFSGRRGNVKACATVLSTVSAFAMLALGMPLPASAGHNIDYPPSAAVPGSAGDPAASTDRIILRLRDNSAVNIEQRVRDVGASAAVPLAHLRRMSGDAQVVRLNTRVSIAEARVLARRLASDPRVLTAEVDHRLVAQAIPNDPMYAQQWHYFEAAGGINLPPAWDVTTGSASIVTAVIDTGIVAHADLSGRILPGYDFIGDTAYSNDGDGRDANAADPGDYGCNGSTSSWHGTHVAGTIGANSNNSSGVSGINWVSKLLPIRVLGKCGGYTSDIVDGLRWAAGIDIPNVPHNPTPARVANLSLGGATGGCSTQFQSAINDVVARGMVVVVAAGNSAADAAGSEPASCNGVITVAATTRTGAKASYSNYGAKVAIAAPGGGDGSGVLSTLNSGSTTPGADSYATYQGTSMATPHVAGTVSLMLSVNPALTPAEVLQRLQQTARVFPTGTGADCTSTTCGAGIVNAGAALAGLAATAPAPTPAPAPAPTTTWTNCAAENATCSFSGTTQVRYGANGIYATRTATSSIACSNAVFGDPVPNVVKSCQYAGTAAAPAPAPTPAPVETWTRCATEGGSCTYSGNRRVRYGANGYYAYRTGAAPVACSNATFGDPLYGTAKACDYSSIVN